MSVAVSRAKLMGAVKELNLRWARVRELWDDSAAANVQASVIEPLEPRVRAAVSAMEKMNALLIRIRSDCQ
jgi:hypothetical protein